MKIIGRWDQSDPYDAVFGIDADLNFSSKYSVAIPLVLEYPSKLITVAGSTLVASDSGGIEIEFKLNLDTSSASTSSSFDSVVVFMTLNGDIIPKSIAYAQPNQSKDGNLTCISSFDLKIEKNNTLNLYAYRILSRGYVGIRSSESQLTMKRRKIDAKN